MQKTDTEEEKEEERTKGSVSWRVYKEYILAGTSAAVAVLAFIIFLVGQVYLHNLFRSTIFISDKS